MLIEFALDAWTTAELAVAPLSVTSVQITLILEEVTATTEMSVKRKITQSGGFG